MNKPEIQPQAALAAPTRFLPLLLILFAGSGCSALIYEIVWYQLLQLVIGSSAVSLGVLLATFMGGLCFGSLTLPRLMPWISAVTAINVVVARMMPSKVRKLRSLLVRSESMAMRVASQKAAPIPIFGFCATDKLRRGFRAVCSIG